MILNYKGKNAIVAGACGGMGLEITKKLAKSKINTLMLDINLPPKDFLNNSKFACFRKIDLTNYFKLKK
tara:strand:+ start:540 stop:746 length:207 start_codon:yes stop_codon:yes gene_type:complete